MPHRKSVSLAGAFSVLCCAYPALAQQEVDFAKELGNVADGVIVIETHPTDQVLVFKGGTHYLAGRELVIRAPLIRIDETTTIQSFDPSSSPNVVGGAPAQAGGGAGGGAWGCTESEILFPSFNGFRKKKIRTCNRHGEIGKTGFQGQKGTDGTPAKPISLVVEKVLGTGKLVLIGNGKRGGEGQKGGTGGTGGRGANGTNRGGDVFCGGSSTPLDGGGGGPGGTGGPGGPGGMGGQGAQISLSANLRQITSLHETIAASWVEKLKGVAELSDIRSLASAEAGSGGKGGAKGDPGPPGGGGDAGKDSHCGGGSKVGAPGSPGQPGQLGADGPTGPKGIVVFN